MSTRKIEKIKHWHEIIDNVYQFNYIVEKTGNEAFNRFWTAPLKLE
jgi:hypothetical protein